jgi:hypothetical protein
LKSGAIMMRDQLTLHLGRQESNLLHVVGTRYEV